MKKSNNNLTIILGIMLLVAVAYILFDFWQESEYKKNFEIYEQGAQYGYEQALYQLASQAVTCEPVPLQINKLGNQTVNQTINLIAVECLQTSE